MKYRASAPSVLHGFVFRIIFTFAVSVLSFSLVSLFPQVTDPFLVQITMVK